MKNKILYAVTTSLLFTSILFADMYIDPRALPQTAITFIKTYFPETTILYVEMDRKEYEVALSNGVEIEFMLNGEWKEVDGHYIALPNSFIPDVIMKTVKHSYPNNVIMKVKKEWNVYQIKLNNMMELYIDISGQLLGQKFDD